MSHSQTENPALTIRMLDKYLHTLNTYEQAAFTHYQTHHDFLLPEETPGELLHPYVMLPTDIRNVNAEAFFHSEMYRRFFLNNNKTFVEYEFFFQDCDLYIHKQPCYTHSPMQSHLFFEICYQYTGESSFEFQGAEKMTSSVLRMGDFFFLPPNQVHSVTVATDSILLNIGVRKSTFIEAFSHNIPKDSILGMFFSDFLNAEHPQHYIHFETNEDAAVCSLIQDLMLTYCTPSLYSRNIMNLQLSLLCLNLLQHYSSRTRITYSDSGKPMNISDVMYYMENNYTSITVQDIAKKFGYSSDYLNQIFKKMTSHTIGEMLLSLKMQKACSLLTDTSLPVSAVAEYLGYHNTPNLIRSFKKYYGITPAQYRKDFHKSTSI